MMLKAMKQVVALKCCLQLVACSKMLLEAMKQVAALKCWKEVAGCFKMLRPHFLDFTTSDFCTLHNLDGQYRLTQKKITLLS